MPPADAPGADWQPPGVRRTPERSDVMRLQAALDRISAACVRRAEREAAAAEDVRKAALAGPPPLDQATVDELRGRLDEAIGRIRALLGEAPP